MTSPATTRITVAVVAALTALTLAGCVGKSDAKPSGPASASVRPSASHSPRASSATPSPTPTPSATAGTPATAVSVKCADLISAQQMYDFNPNFGLDTSFAPKAGTNAATAVSNKGIACNWTNQTSSETITFSAARPGSTLFASLKSSAAAGAAPGGLGDAAWFAAAGDTGTLQVFRGGYWLTATSVYFGSAADASDLTNAALSALK